MSKTILKHSNQKIQTMRKTITFSVLMLLAAMSVLSCSDDDDNNQTSEKTKVTKIADYLYEYTVDGYSPEAPSELLSDDGSIPVFGCSSVRNGNFYGRNFDFNINEICEFVVRTKASASRKHASIGVANPGFLTITNDMVQAGLSDEELNFIPWMTMDGINDAGLVCNLNVVNAADIKDFPHTHTCEGAPKINVMNIVRALLDNCGSVEEAKAFIGNHDIIPMPSTWDGHLMMADPHSTVVVEFTGEKGSEVKYTETNIMTNFYNYQFARDGIFPPHVCGMERYQILKDNYATGNSMEGMWNLLKKVRYTQTYEEATEPFWCSEYYNTSTIPTFDEHPMAYWTKEKILSEVYPQEEVAAYREYAKTGRYSLDDELWFTTHNATYDIANKSLWVTIREKYEKRYEFKLQ